MVRVHHSTSHLSSLGPTGLAAALQHMLLGEQPVSVQNLRQLANELLDAASHLQSQASHMQLQQQQQTVFKDSPLATVESPDVPVQLTAPAADGTLQQPTAEPLPQADSPLMSSPAAQPGHDLARMQLAAPQIITAEGQSRRGKRKLGTLKSDTELLPSSPSTNTLGNCTPCSTSLTIKPATPFPACILVNLLFLLLLLLMLTRYMRSGL